MPKAQPLIERFLARVPAGRLTDEAIERTAPVVAKNPVPLAEPPPARRPLSTVALILLAFAGGLLLNVMPCVLPVLSIKLLGLVQQAGHARRLIWRNAVLSAAGIIASFLGLGVVAVAAKAGGRAVGWGIQFQNPVFCDVPGGCRFGVRPQSLGRL